MSRSHPSACDHPLLTRRTAVQAGAIGLLGFGMNHVAALRSAAGATDKPRAGACIYIFLSGGLSQIDSFDPKPAAPDSIRGEFQPISTRTPGMQICEHLPQLAQRSHMWSLCRSLTHGYNEHFQGHMAMLSGRTPLPPAFDLNKPQPSDWPSIAAVANHILPPRTNLPSAMILPERLIDLLGRAVHGQGAGMMGQTRDPWIVEASRYTVEFNGAYPEYAFHPIKGRNEAKGFAFKAPNLSLPEGLNAEQFRRRVELLEHVDAQQRGLGQAAERQSFDRFRENAISLLSDGRTQQAFDVHSADPQTLDRYGRNSFGWSLLMARQLVEAGVSLVQVNLGNMFTWDTHANEGPNLKNYLFPPMDQSVSALLDDLHERGLLDSTLVVMGSEFGRTPHRSTGPNYTSPGRNHWGGVQSVLLAGGGIQGGRVVGASDKISAYPALHPQKPENMAATIYEALGVPRSITWRDSSDRPHLVYHGEPIPGLS